MSKEKSWRYQDLDEDGNHFEIILSESEIIEEHWDSYVIAAKAFGADMNTVTEQGCIMDWRIINWAEEIQEV